jgi:hypothetical protein
MKYELKIAEYTIAQQARLLKKLARSKASLIKSKHHTNGYQSAGVSVLRKEARAHHLALGFLRGRTMDNMELPLRALNKGHISSNGLTRTAPDWERVEELVLKHGKKYFDNEQDIRQSFTEFKDSWTVVDV